MEDGRWRESGGGLVTWALRFLSRVLPVRLQSREVLTDTKRFELLGSVGDHDPCLRAVLDLQQETLEHEFYAAIDPQRPDVERLRACEGMLRRLLDGGALRVDGLAAEHGRDGAEVGADTARQHGIRGERTLRVAHVLRRREQTELALVAQAQVDEGLEHLEAQASCRQLRVVAKRGPLEIRDEAAAEDGVVTRPSSFA